MKANTRTRIEKQKILYSSSSLSLSIRIRRGHPLKKKNVNSSLANFSFPLLSFPSLILDSFYRHATIRFDFKPDRGFLILASSVQRENENERLPFSTSPISSIVRHSEEIKRHEEKTETLAYLYAFYCFFFFFFFLSTSKSFDLRFTDFFSLYVWKGFLKWDWTKLV